jgi:hypothetical protein
MAGIGKEDYPQLTPSEAFEIVEKVGRENVKTANGLASVMGLKSPDSGYFYHQVSSLTKYYGLLDRAKGSITLTPLGERIAHPLSEGDKSLARAEAVRRVTLLNSLYGRLGGEFHEADFRTTLRDVTQAPLADIERSAPDVEKLFRDAVRYLSHLRPTSGATARETPRVHEFAAVPENRLSAEAVTPVKTHEVGYRTFESDGVYLKIKKDRDSLEEALATIEGWLKRHTGSASKEHSKD